MTITIRYESTLQSFFIYIEHIYIQVLHPTSIQLKLRRMTIKIRKDLIVARKDSIDMTYAASESQTTPLNSTHKFLSSNQILLA